jgi:hypothetical protein
MTETTVRIRGASYFRADLHIHSPASTDFQDKSATAKQLVEAAAAKGLEIIAVTDHNSAEWVDLVRSAAKGTSLAVFPGVEISSPTCHILAIFDRATPKATLDDLLSSVGITNDKRGKETALAQPAEAVLEQVKRFGGIAIAAHANSTNGLLQGGTGQYKIKLYHMNELAALEFTKEKDVQDFMQGKISGYGPRACVQGSDAHALTEIGRRFTYLKMDGVSLRGIGQALLDYEVRVRFAWNAPATLDHPRIVKMIISQGFFGGSTFEFHPNLNCFIGGKGTGKSTVVEFMRYCFGDVSKVEDIQTDATGKVSALLGDGGLVQVEYLDSDGEKKLISRDWQGWSTDTVVKDENGNASTIITAPVFFSQGELTRIASSSIAQLELVDRYIDIQGEAEAEENVINALREVAIQLEDLKSQDKKVLEELEDKETGLAASRETYKALEKTLKTAIFSEFPKWESEGRYVSGVSEALSVVQASFEETIDSLEPAAHFPPKPDTDSPNYEVFAFIDEFPKFLQASLTKAREDFGIEIQQRRADLKELLSLWQTEFDEKKSEYERALEELGELDLRRAQAKLRNLRMRLDSLEEKKKRHETRVAQMEEVADQRVGLLTGLNEARTDRFKKRQAKASQWQELLQGKIKVKITFGSNRTHYFEKLKVLAKGAKLREPDLKALVQTFHPSALVELVVAGDANELSQKTQVKAENCQKLINALQSHELTELFELELVPLPDYPEIQYQVEPGHYKALHELSVGGKGTVIISLALIEGHAPLVIDQPEEPLDTLAIHEQIVGTLRRQKDSRQFIFTTHNANVAVGADAELSHVLEATADKGSIRSSGGIDCEETNRLLLHHLEGGGVAFDLRARKYIR